MIELSQNGLLTDQDKCIYMASFFEEGATKQWYISVCISQTHLLDSFEDFCNEFQAHFGNPNIATSAKYKINVLSWMGSVASYVAHYFELLVHVNWCYDFEDIVLRSDEYLNSQSEKLR